MQTNSCVRHVTGSIADGLLTRFVCPRRSQIYYPFNYVLPAGYMFTFCGRSGYVFDWRNNSWFTDVPRLRGYATTQFPFTGTSVLLGLYPENKYQVRP